MRLRDITSTYMCARVRACVASHKSLLLVVTFNIIYYTLNCIHKTEYYFYDDDTNLNLNVQCIITLIII